MKVKTNLSSVTVVASEITVKHECDVVASIQRHQIPLTGLVWHHQRLTLFVPLSLSEDAVNVLHSHFTGVTSICAKQEMPADLGQPAVCQFKQ